MSATLRAAPRVPLSVSAEIGSHTVPTCHFRDRTVLIIADLDQFQCSLAVCQHPCLKQPPFPLIDNI